MKKVKGGLINSYQKYWEGIVYDRSVEVAGISE